MEKINQKGLKRLLSYDPKTGIFTRRISRGNCFKKGGIAGHTGNDGYVSININGVSYKAHRLAWLYMEGFFPKNIDIDHIDRNRANNARKNLRLVSRQCNTRNCNVRKNSTSKVTGVYWLKDSKKWRARIMADGKSYSLGCFLKIDDAVKARWEAEKKHNYPDCNTTSSAYLYLHKELM